MENTVVTTLDGLSPARALPGLGAFLFTHATAKRLSKVTSVCRTAHVGAVYSLRGRTADSLTALAQRHIHDVGDASGLLIDSGLYVGKKRSPGTDDLDGRWINAQHRAGIGWALTDSGYIGEARSDALSNILRQTAEMPGPVIGVLPVHKSWLTKRADELRTAIEKAGVPVALMVEDKDDPFATKPGAHIPAKSTVLVEEVALQRRSRPAMDRPSRPTRLRRRMTLW